ncbi:MAG: hypothetical protein J6B95_08180 [Oscillospiraceae bacterium]|nr:hypothetical protein [Oscillospiraceae bacterium]
MSWSVKTDAVTGMMKFSLADEDGAPVASFRLNPTDIRLASRFQEAAGWFEDLSKNAPGTATVAEVQQYNDTLEEKLGYVLGGNARETLFGVMPAVSIMPDGSLFAVEVFGKLSEAVIPEIKSRRQKMQTAASKYTAKYVPTIPDDVLDAAVKQAGALKY